MSRVPVCVPCAREMICDRNSVYTDYGDGAFLVGDRYRCPECPMKIVTGFCREFFELAPDVKIKPDVYQRVRQPQFPDHKPEYHSVLTLVEADRPEDS